MELRNLHKTVKAQMWQGPPPFYEAMDKYSKALMGLLKEKKFFYKNLIIHNCLALKKKNLCKRNIKTLDAVSPPVYSLQAAKLAHACGAGARITLAASARLSGCFGWEEHRFHRG